MAYQSLEDQYQQLPSYRKALVPAGWRTVRPELQEKMIRYAQTTTSDKVFGSDDWAVGEPAMKKRVGFTDQEIATGDPLYRPRRVGLEPPSLTLQPTNGLGQTVTQPKSTNAHHLSPQITGALPNLERGDQPASNEFVDDWLAITKEQLDGDPTMNSSNEGTNTASMTDTLIGVPAAGGVNWPNAARTTATILGNIARAGVKIGPAPVVAGVALVKPTNAGKEVTTDSRNPNITYTDVPGDPFFATVKDPHNGQTTGVTLSKEANGLKVRPWPGQAADPRFIDAIAILMDGENFIHLMDDDADPYKQAGNGIRNSDPNNPDQVDPEPPEPKGSAVAAGLGAADKLNQLAQRRRNTGNRYRPIATPPEGIKFRTYLGSLDAYGRPTGIVATIETSALRTGSEAAKSIVPPGYLKGASVHHKGHLLARVLGGTGKDARNLVTLFEKSNNPGMLTFERQIQRAVETGETVNLKVTPKYSGTDPIPIGVEISARGSNGLKIDVSVPNNTGLFK